MGVKVTLEKFFPRVFEPQSIGKFSTACYQALYESNEEAKRYVQIVEANYCSSISTLGENEKSYMQRYVNAGLHLAKKMKKVNRRNLLRKEKAEFDRKVSFEEAVINKSRYLKALEEIKNDELEKTKSVFGRGAKVLPPLTSSASFAFSYIYLDVPKEPSALIAGIAGVATYATFKILQSRKMKQAIQNCCEDQNGTEKYYTDRLREIEREYSRELLKIESDKDKENDKHVSKEIRDLKNAWRFYGVGLEDAFNLGTLAKVLI